MSICISVNLHPHHLHYLNHLRRPSSPSPPAQLPPTLARSPELQDVLDIHVNVLQGFLNHRRPWIHIYIYIGISSIHCTQSSSQ